VKAIARVSPSAVLTNRFGTSSRAGKDQGVDHRDRDHARREAAEMVVQIRAQQIAETDDDCVECSGRHQ
jgi:hypothetical protein